jgi:hypothetical protein
MAGDRGFRSVQVMNATDYLINAALVLLVLRQVRETRLTWPILVLPVLIVVGAAAYYLRSVPTAGNDLLLDLTVTGAGAVLGGLCALFTHLRRDADGTPLSRAGWVAAILWVVGIGARMGFAWAISHGAAPAIERFSVAHSITSVDAWVAALFLMALAEVVTRLVVLWIRSRRLPAPTAASAQVPARAIAAV